MYLFITEDGTSFQKEDITEVDRDAVEEGIVTVFKFENGEFYEINLDGTDWGKVEVEE